MIQGNLREEVIGSPQGMHIQATNISIQIKQGPDSQEENVNHHKYPCKREHVLLGFRQVLATEVFLHKILVKAGHGNGDKDPSHELFDEMNIIARKVVPEKYLGIGTVLYCFKCL